MMGGWGKQVKEVVWLMAVNKEERAAQTEGKRGMVWWGGGDRYIMRKQNQNGNLQVRGGIEGVFSTLCFV